MTMLSRGEAMAQERIPLLPSEGAVYAFTEPGNGTRYSAAICGWSEGPWATLGVCGSVGVGWLVVCGLNGKAYLLQTEGALHPAYVAEKFELPPRHAQHFARLVGRVLNRPVPDVFAEE